MNTTDPKGVSDSHYEQDEQVSTANPFGRDLPPYTVLIGQSRRGIIYLSTQDNSLTGGDE